MQAEQKKFIAKIWDKRAADLPFSSQQEAIILASIVEKETGRADERARVAGVFINRLEKRMRLQSDPTIIYGVSEGKGTLGRPIRKSELVAAHPYNTYQTSGLTPTAISNPGRASIEAVLRPARTEALFFVADGTGGHAFSKTLNEHNRNVAKWRVIEVKIRARQAKEARLAALRGDEKADETTPTDRQRMEFPGMVAGGLPGHPPGTELGTFNMPGLTQSIFPGIAGVPRAGGSTEEGVPLPERNPRLR